MKSLITKTTSALSGVILVAFAAVMAGFGLAMIGVLAVFGLAALALAMVTAPFAAVGEDEPREDATEVTA